MMPDSEESADNCPEGPSWWVSFLHPVPHPMSPWSDLRGSPRWALLVPVTLIAVTVFASTYWTVSDETFLDRIILKAQERATTPEQKEAIERSREPMARAMNNPVVRIWFSLSSVWIVSRSFLLFLAVSWLMFAALSGQWRGFPRFSTALFLSSGVVSAGIVVQTLLGYTTGEEQFSLPLSFVVNLAALPSPWRLLLAELNLFFLWFLLVASARVSRFSGETVLASFSVLLLSWLILILGSDLVGAQFGIFP